MKESVITKPKTYEEAALPDKPSPGHTVLVVCQSPGCVRKRWCKPQDAWQVKLCLACRDAKKKAKSAIQLASVKKKVEAREELQRRRAYIPRLSVIKFLWPTSQERAKWAKPKRIWA